MLIDKERIAQICEKDYWYCDVDGTLIFWGNETPGVPRSGMPRVNESLVEALRAWKRAKMARGEECRLIVWSGEGRQHAEWACSVAEIRDIVDFCCGKPQVIIDDTPEVFMSGRLLGKYCHFVQILKDANKPTRH